MIKLLELAKKYGFRVDQKNLIVPANISTVDLEYLISKGYYFTFEIPPRAYPWLEKFLESKEKEV